MLGFARARLRATLCCAVAMAVSTPTASLAQRGAGTPDTQTLDRMFAPSPQRELRRAWEECVSTAAYLAVGSGKTLAEMRPILQLVCSEQESRLTGAMVREFGYDRGNAAMSGLWAAAMRTVERLIAARDTPPTRQYDIPGSALAERLPGGWEVHRAGQYGCGAVLMEQSIYGGTTAATLGRMARGDRVTFMQISSEAARAAVRFGGTGARIRTGVSALANNTGHPIGSIEFEIQLYPDGIGFEAVLTPQLLDELSRAEAVQFSPAWSGSMVGTPRTFNVRGAAAAWAGVLRCMGRSTAAPLK